MMLFDLIHFERPFWLIAIPAIFLLAYLFSPSTSKKIALNKLVDEKLMKHLEYKNTKSNTNKIVGLMVLSLSFIALAGISWTKEPTEMFESTQKTILVVDQSLSMYATDIKPNRQTQLKQTVRDILEQSKEGDLALVAFAGEAFVISPFSQDRETITHFLLALEPVIMPTYGSNLTKGVEAALSLHQNPEQPLHLIILTDDLTEEDQDSIPTLLSDLNIQLDVIAVGTEEASVIKLPDGRTLKRDGRNISPITPIEDLKRLTNSLNGQFYQGRLNTTELARISNSELDSQQAEKAENKSIHWLDQGHWFALPFLLWLGFQFRRGMAFILVIGVMSFPSEKLLAASPFDIFLTPDQKGQKAVEQGDWSEAEQHFIQPDWKAASSYALENYEGTINSLEKLDRNAVENYNLGNAYALSGDTQKAIESYERALQQDDSLDAAKENLAYLKNEEQKQKEEQENQDSSESNDDQKNQNDQQEPSDSNDKNEQKDPSDSKKDNKENETQDKEKTPEDNKTQDNQEQQESAEPKASQPLDKEQQQALNQWLRQIQDDPGLLLQRKLWYLHQERRNDNRFIQENRLNTW